MRFFRRPSGGGAAPPASHPYDPEATQPLGHAERATVHEQAVPVEAPPPRPRIWPWLVLLLVLLAAGLGALFALARDGDDDASATTTAPQTQQVDVPDVVGQRADRAVAQLVDSGLKTELQRTLSTKASGIVLEQDPRASASVPAGSTVVLTISRGANTVSVPAVTGLSLDQALARLSAAGLKGTSKRVFAAQPAGQVTAQEPGGGSELKRGGSVILTVSKGKQPVEVPGVVGLNRTEAATTLDRAGFRAGVLEVPSSEPVGTVVAQNPTAGERAARGSTVQINISKGRGTTGGTATEPASTHASGTVTVPDVVDLTLGEATRQLVGAGLRVDTKRVSSSRPEGTVLAQFPAAGDAARRGGTVRVNVSSGPTTTAVPDVVGDDEATARDRLERAGFIVNVVEQDTADPAEEGVVVDQEPAAGTQRKPGAEVTVFVGVLASG